MVMFVGEEYSWAAVIIGAEKTVQSLKCTRMAYVGTVC